MTDFEKRVREIQGMMAYRIGNEHYDFHFEAVNEAVAAIMQEVRGLVPPPMVYQDGTARDKDYESGWNDCRKEILKKLEGES